MAFKSLTLLMGNSLSAMKIFLPAPVYQPYRWVQGSAGGTDRDQAEKVSASTVTGSNVTWGGRSGSCLPVAVQLTASFGDSSPSLHCSVPGWTARVSKAGDQQCVGGLQLKHTPFIYHRAFSWSTGKVDKTAASGALFSLGIRKRWS